MAKKFEWDENTKYEDIPKRLRNKMPAHTNLDALDEVNQMDHIRFRVQHEIDMIEEEQPGYFEDYSKADYRKAKEFMALTSKD